MQRPDRGFRFWCTKLDANWPSVCLDSKQPARQAGWLFIGSIQFILEVNLINQTLSRSCAPSCRWKQQQQPSERHVHDGRPTVVCWPWRSLTTRPGSPVCAPARTAYNATRYRDRWPDGRQRVTRFISIGPGDIVANVRARVHAAFAPRDTGRPTDRYVGGSY